MTDKHSNADTNQSTETKTNDRTESNNIKIEAKGQCRHVVVDGVMVADYDVVTGEFLVFDPDSKSEKPCVKLELTNNKGV